MNKIALLVVGFDLNFIRSIEISFYLLMVFLSGAYQAFTMAGLPFHLNQNKFKCHIGTRILNKP